MSDSSFASFQRTLESEQATHALGVEIGKILCPGIVVALIGTLGSGKTRLTQAIAESLSISEPVVSPTYTLCVPYAGRVDLLHMDAYRINSPEEVDELNLFERVDDGEVLIVEWADRIEAQLPDIDLRVELLPVSHETREITIVAQSEKGDEIVKSLLASSA